MDDIDGRQTQVRVEVSAATDDDDDHINENTAASNSSDIANNVITSIIVDSRDDKERHCISLPLYYDQIQGELCALGSGPGMECMPLRSPPGAYHYHVNDQTKSLQELQNEVGALLEFRDLVIETFPDLKNKMASISTSNTITGAPSSSLASRREWEPGIRVRRKLTQKDTVVDISSSSLIRSRSNSHSGKKEPKSGEGNNGSVVQDSGFSTETSSSKETHSASSTTGSSTVVPIATGSNVTNSASGALATHRIINTSTTHDTEDELWNLLDVIHRKSTRLREEVENLQQLERDSRMYQANSSLSEMFQLELNRINKEDIQLLRKDRDRLLDKLAEMEAETIAARIKSTRMEDEMKALNLVKCDLEEQLRTALSQKFELNTRLNELVGNSDRNIGDINPNSLTDSRNTSRLRSRKLSSPDTVVTISPYTNRMPTGTNTFSPVVVKSSQQQQQQLQLTQFEPSDAKQIKNDFNLGRLDGLVSSPNRSSKVQVADSNKIAAILLETNIVELQRHLLTITVQNQLLTQKLEQATKSKIYLIKKLDKAKEEMDDLRFQLEERNIELEGTKAQLRVLESRTIGSKLDFSPQHMLYNHCDLPIIQNQVSTPSMKAMIPLPMDDLQNHSSSTESAHDHAERDSRTCPDTPKRRPSKIPLAGTKGYLAPKPPTGRNFVNSKSPSGPPSNKSLSKSTSSLVGRSGPSSIKNIISTKLETPSSLNRPESAQSIRKDTSLGNTSRNGSSIPISSSKVSPSRTNNSPVPKAKRESFTSKVRHMDSLSRMHTSPSHSNATTPITPSNSTTSLYKSNMGKDLSSSFSNSRERRQSYNSNHSTTSSPTAGSTPVRRAGNANGGNKGIDLTTATEPVEKIYSTIPSPTKTKSNRSISNRDLIREYLARTRAPPAIFRSTTFSTFTNPLQQQQQLVDLAYKHPRLLIDNDDEQVDNCAGVDDVADEVDSVGPMNIDANNFSSISELNDHYLTHFDSRSNQNGNEHLARTGNYTKNQNQIVDSIKSSSTFASNSFNNLSLSHLNRQFDENCKLIGRVNPSLVKTWEQLNGNRMNANEHIAYAMNNEVVNTVDAIATLTKNNGKSFVIYHAAENSGHYYDSIDNESVITRTEDDEVDLDQEIATSSIDEMAVTAGGEAMADFLSIVSNDRKFCWSVESNNQ